ncbi:MAG: GNAT family N-acetyltransferase, partial [Gemmataceae bacterium]
MARFQAEILRSTEQLRQFEFSWRELLASAHQPDLVNYPDWLLPWWEIFGPEGGRQLRCLVLRDESGVVGFAPFLARTHWHGKAVPFRRLEFLASGEGEADSICSEYLEVLARAGREAEVAGELVRHLREGALGPWDEVVLSMMPGDRPMAGLIMAEAVKCGWSASQSELMEAPYIPLPTSWESYLKSLTGTGRRQITRGTRLFEEWAGEDWKIEYASEETLKKGQSILHSLHHDRWRDTGKGVFHSSKFLAFHETVMATLMKQGALDLCWLVVRSEPVSAMYFFRWNGKVSYYQAGRRLDVPQRIRPGGILLYHAIRRAIEMGQKEFDFLGGKARFKMELALACRSLVEVRLARPGFREGIRKG